MERDTRALNSRPTVSLPFLPNCRHIQMSLFFPACDLGDKRQSRSFPMHEKRKVEIGKLLRANGKRCVFIFEGLFLSTLRVRNRLAFLKAFFECHIFFRKGVMCEQTCLAISLALKSDAEFAWHSFSRRQMPKSRFRSFLFSYFDRWRRTQPIILRNEQRGIFLVLTYYGM